MHRAAHALFNICLILALTAGLLVLVADKRTSKNPISVFGRQLMVVVSGSMEPNIGTGSIIVVKQVDIGSVGRGEVITFIPQDADDVYVTHRVVDVNADGSFVTKGDANNVRDNVNVRPNDIVGQVHFVIPFLGYAVLAVRSIPGLAVIAVIILTLLVMQTVELFKLFTPAEGRYMTIGVKSSRRD